MNVFLWVFLGLAVNGVLGAIFWWAVDDPIKPIDVWGSPETSAVSQILALELWPLILLYLLSLAIKDFIRGSE